MRRASFILAAVLLLGTTVTAQQLIQKPAQKEDAAQKNGTTQLTLQVLTEKSKQPVADAHVVVRFKEERLLRRDKRVSWEAKTNRKGVVVLSDIPFGAVKVQVIARGYQTYGDEHDLSKSEEAVTVLLQTPKGQVSAY